MEEETYRSFVNGLEVEDLESLFESLTPRERYILEQYYGESGMILREIGDKLGVSKDRVRQIRNIAFSKLRRQSRLIKIRKSLYKEEVKS